MEKTYNIKNKQTGYIFNMSKADCDRLVLEEPYNFEVVDKDYVSPIKEEPKETPTFKKVVVEDKPKALEDYSVPELKEYLTKNNVEFKSSAKKAELLELALNYNELECEKAEKTRLLLEKADKYGVEYTDKTSDNELETAIIEKLTAIVKEKDIELTQNPVTIDYLEDLLKDNEE